MVQRCPSAGPEDPIGLEEDPNWEASIDGLALAIGLRVSVNYPFSVIGLDVAHSALEGPNHQDVPIDLDVTIVSIVPSAPTAPMVRVVCFVRVYPIFQNGANFSFNGCYPNYFSNF